MSIHESDATINWICKTIAQYVLGNDWRAVRQHQQNQKLKDYHRLHANTLLQRKANVIKYCATKFEALTACTIGEARPSRSSIGSTCRIHKCFSGHDLLIIQSNESKLLTVNLVRSKAPTYEVGHTAPRFCCRCLRQVLARKSPAATSALRSLSEAKRTRREHRQSAAVDPKRPSLWLSICIASNGLTLTRSPRR
jgi:hypothetical protein